MDLLRSAGIDPGRIPKTTIWGAIGQRRRGLGRPGNVSKAQETIERAIDLELEWQEVPAYSSSSVSSFFLPIRASGPNVDEDILMTPGQVGADSPSRITSGDRAGMHEKSLTPDGTTLTDTTTPVAKKDAAKKGVEKAKTAAESVGLDGTGLVTTIVGSLIVTLVTIWLIGKGGTN